MTDTVESAVPLLSDELYSIINPFSIRPRISAAALLVKVTDMIENGDALALRHVTKRYDAPTLRFTTTSTCQNK